MINVTRVEPCQHEFGGLWHAIAKSRVEKLSSDGGYRVTLPDYLVFLRSSLAAAWSISEYRQASWTRTAGSCTDPGCREFWSSADPALELRIEQHERALRAVNALLRIYRRTGAYLPPREVIWWLRQGDWLLRSEAVRAAAEEACLIAADRAAAGRLRPLTREEIVVLDAPDDDEYLPTALGSQLQDAALRISAFQARRDHAALSGEWTESRRATPGV